MPLGSCLLGAGLRRFEFGLCVPRRTAMSSNVQPRLESCSSFKSHSHARMRCFAGSS